MVNEKKYVAKDYQNSNLGWIANLQANQTIYNSKFGKLIPYLNNSIFYTMLIKGSGRNFCYPYGCNKGKFIKRKKKYKYIN